MSSSTTTLFLLEYSKSSTALHFLANLEYVFSLLSFNKEILHSALLMLAFLIFGLYRDLPVDSVWHHDCLPSLICFLWTLHAGAQHLVGSISSFSWYHWYYSVMILHHHLSQLWSAVPLATKFSSLAPLAYPVLLFILLLM